MTVVLLVQAPFFADGGLTALGVNVVNMSLVTVLVGYLVFMGLRRVLPMTRKSVVTASFVAALVSVPVASMSFVLFYALGGRTDVPRGQVAAALLGVHILIGWARPSSPHLPSPASWRPGLTSSTARDT